MSRQKSDDGGGTDIDRLSTLPDSVLCEILSFLPTRTSVTTMSLVSRRWRHLWKDLQVFRFEYFGGREKEFVFFVNAVLALRNSRCIRKFYLSIQYYADYEILDDSIKVWILAAVGPHLEEMSLALTSGYVSTILPPSFFMNCTNLVSLSLSGEIYMNDKHSSVYFPSLKKLVIHSFITDFLKVRFLSGCPRLETLDTYFENGNSMNQVFTQHSSSSKSLNSTNDNLTWTYLAFQIHNEFLRLGIISYFQSMAESFVHVFPQNESEFVDPFLERLRYYYTDIDLILSHSTSKWPIHAPVLNCPEFHNLHHLKFILPCSNSNLLLNVLEKCHMLQVLIIQSNKEKEKPSPLRTWEPHSTKVPECFKSHLTYIHIEGYQGFEDELTFAEYLLRNGLVLETMLIFVDTSMDITNKSRFIKRLTNITKGSIRCQLKFDPYGST